MKCSMEGCRATVSAQVSGVEEFDVIAWYHHAHVFDVFSSDEIYVKQNLCKVLKAYILEHLSHKHHWDLIIFFCISTSYASYCNKQRKKTDRKTTNIKVNSEAIKASNLIQPLMFSKPITRNMQGYQFVSVGQLNAYIKIEKKNNSLK